jgi:two-component system, chemotaxis family, sensor kinase Cph1
MTRPQAPTSVEQAHDLAACAREPIHVPGAIQPHGLLLVVDPDSDGVVQGAGDAAALVGFDGPLPGATVQAVLGTSLADLLRQGGVAVRHQPTYIGTLHAPGGRGDLTLLAHWVHQVAVVEALPAAPSASAAATLADIRSITEHIGGATDVLEACQRAAGEIRRITGYDRIMVYRFLPDGSGAVIAEVRHPDLTPFLNHRYPESDIPAQARELYRRSAIRVIPDVGYTPAPLVPPADPPGGPPLDMSHCTLRSVSPVHIRYLKNMGVGASMSVSLLPRGDLWGLIACHNTTPAQVPYEAQEACRHVGQILSQLIAARNDTDAERIAHSFATARDSVLHDLAARDEVGAIFTVCPGLKTIAASDGVAVAGGPTSAAERVATAGHAPDKARILRLAEWLEPRLASAEYLVTDSLAEDWPEAAEIASGFASGIGGLLATRLPGDDPLILMWFRAEQVQEVMWAGNPHQPLDPATGPGSLNPRASFATWVEKVAGRSRPWELADIESIRAFRPAAAFILQQQRVRQLNRLLGEANRQLAALASSDGLTGIPNRRAFDERLREEWTRAARSGRPLGLIILDLDFFKQYNDHFGHPTGDTCLKSIARLLDDTRRATDFAARVGGEEFALLLPETDRDGALAVAEATRANIERLGTAHPKCPAGIMTASLGVACLQAGKAETAHDLMKMADRALYEAKRQGRNRVVLQASSAAAP